MFSFFFDKPLPDTRRHDKVRLTTLRRFTGLLAFSLTTSLTLTASLAAAGITAHATEVEQTLAIQRAIPIESNQIADWPTGPVVSAESAILIEAETGAILYEKNIHEKQYPASTTKILTTLIAYEEADLDETVTFSHDAVYGIPSDSNHIAMNEGDTLSMEDCLNAILIRSANEVSYAVAEHVGGDWATFAQMMNDRAKELGCVDSNFVNPNGLPDENHYTSAHDLAMIGRAFFANELLCKMTTTPMLIIQKESGEYRDVNQMALLPNKKYAYDYLVGCKTGYTNDARSSLVSCAEKDGLKLICVVLRDENPYQYEDTIALFEYGFANFGKINISETETKYNIDTTGSFYSDNAIFGSSKPMLSLNQDSYIVLPKTADFADTVSTISYDTQNENQAALINYTYNNVFVGSASVDLAVNNEESYSFDIKLQTPEDAPAVEKQGKEEGTTFIFINVVKVLLYILGGVAVIAIIAVIIYVAKNYHFAQKNNRRSWLRERRKRRSYSSNLTASDSIQSRRKQQIKEAKRRQRSHKRNKSNTSIKFRDYD